MLVTTLSGLNSDYIAFSTSIRLKYPPVIIRELHNLLLSEEVVVTNRSKSLLVDSTAKAFAAHSSNYRPNFNAFGGGHSPNYRGKRPFNPNYRGGFQQPGFSRGSSSGSSLQANVLVSASFDYFLQSFVA